MNDAGAELTHYTGANRAARVVTEISGPAICCIAGLLTVAIRASGTNAGAAWGGLAAIFVAIIPMAYVVRGVQKGRWSDHHVGDRNQRTRPLLVASASVAVGVTFLVLFHAPRDIVALTVAMLVGLLVVMVVTRWWKISVHVATAAGLLAILTILFGPYVLFGLPLLAAIAWSRVVLDDHTWPQVIAGALLGSAVATAMFLLLR